MKYNAHELRRDVRSVLIVIIVAYTCAFVFAELTESPPRFVSIAEDTH